MGFEGLASDTVNIGSECSNIVADIVIHSNTMPGSAIAQLPSFLASSIPKSPALSLSIKGKMDSHGDMGLLGEHYETSSLVARVKEDGYESRSGSDNVEGASGDDQDAAQYEPPRKKYARHSAHQIQELEAAFQRNYHPDEKERLELSRRLGLESKQIKFWFQNRRTQMKTQLERHENVILKQENDKLRAENELLKQTIADPICNTCGGPVVPGPVSFEQQQLRIENARIKDELGRLSALASKFLGRPLSSSASPVPSFSPNSKLDLAVGRNGYGSLAHLEMPVGLDYNDGVVTPLMKPMAGAVGNEMPYDRSMYVDLAFAAMDELVKMVQIDSSLWIKSLDGGREALNPEEYRRTFSPRIGMKPSSFVTEATRETGIVLINSMALVETLMDANRWVEMFSSIIARASTLDIISSGLDGTKNGVLQVMHAEFQVVSPMVPVRQVKFLRFCKKHAEGVWAVVDVSINTNQENSSSYAFPDCRRLPSGCIIQDMQNGCCKIAWLEHSEYDESAVHELYRPVLSSGRGFGAQRWVATLQRFCECAAILASPTISREDQTGTVLDLGSKKSIVKLAQRMVDNFCSGVCASSTRKWEQLVLGNIGEDVRILTRKSINEHGEPSGTVLSASTSVWLPVMRQRLFNFLRDEHSRSEWDILCTGGLMQEMIHVAKGQERGNCVCLLRSNALEANANESGMLILQETWSDVSGSLVVYAPVDLNSISVVMSGGDSTFMALLPSGFVILPDDSPIQNGPNNCNGTSVKRDIDGGDGGGSFLTVGFQILLNDLLASVKLSETSIETVRNLISGTIQRIKAALQLT